MTVTLDTEPDFGGWATKAGLRCADGLTIGHDAFKAQDGARVPLVYQHGHTDLEDVLGHAILENRGEGVYAHCYFNDNPKSVLAKNAVQHGDLTMMSIYANQLRKARGDTVTHGNIIEVSIVQAGANPGAQIDFMSIRHSDGTMEIIDEEALITTGLEIQHSALEPVSTDPDAIWDSMTDAQRELAQSLMHTVRTKTLEDAGIDPDADSNDGDSDKEPEGDSSGDDNADTDPDADAADAGDGGDGTSPDAASAADAPPADAAVQHGATNNDLEGSDMTETLVHRVFDQEQVLEHKLGGKAINNAYQPSKTEQLDVLQQAQRGMLLSDAVGGWALQHGIDNIEILFPDAKAVSDKPEWLKRRTEWVARVLSGTKHTPFSRIKSLTADITLDAARAKGYLKGDFKEEEFFSVAKRTTGPQTIYKKQQLDRDDIIDITDFDVVLWIKGEMRIMLDEEIARAVLIGDGRSNADKDKIREDSIRPIASDHALYQTTIRLNLGNANSSPEEIVDAILLNRRYYKGSGNPDFFTTEETIARLLNVKDTLGRRIYTSLQDLATTLRVASIIPVEVMEEQGDLIGIIVNLSDYTIGADRGGDVTMFEDFDIDYNQQKYLIETRCSGALTKAKSALVLRRTADNAVPVTPVAPSWDASSHSLTVASTSGLAYRNQANGAVLSSSTPVTLAEGQEIVVEAVPTSNAYYLETSEQDEFLFTYSDGLVDTK